jgi:hypothetical protein
MMMTTQAVKIELVTGIGPMVNNTSAGGCGVPVELDASAPDWAKRPALARRCCIND